MGGRGQKRPQFEATIRKAGINPYIDVPPSISETFGTRGNIPVKGTIDGMRFRSTLVPVGRGRHRLYINSEMRRAASVGVGDRVSIYVRYDSDPRKLPVPAALTAALAKDATARARWDRWSPSSRKEVLAYLNSLKRPETLKRNVTKVISKLRQER